MLYVEGVFGGILQGLSKVDSPLFSNRYLAHVVRHCPLTDDHVTPIIVREHYVVVVPHHFLVIFKGPEMLMFSCSISISTPRSKTPSLLDSDKLFPCFDLYEDNEYQSNNFQYVFDAARRSHVEHLNRTKIVNS